MKSFIAGASGAIGSRLVPQLAADVVAKAELNPPADAVDGVAALRHLEDGVTR